MNFCPVLGLNPLDLSKKKFTEDSTLDFILIHNWSTLLPFFTKSTSFYWYNLSYRTNFSISSTNVGHTLNINPVPHTHPSPLPILYSCRTERFFRNIWYDYWNLKIDSFYRRGVPKVSLFTVCKIFLVWSTVCILTILSPFASSLLINSSVNIFRSTDGFDPSSTPQPLITHFRLYKPLTIDQPTPYFFYLPRSYKILLIYRININSSILTP